MPALFIRTVEMAERPVGRLVEERCRRGTRGLSWREQPASVDIMVSASPEAAANRVSDNQRLMLKDINEALIYFLRETPSVSPASRRP